METTTHLSKQPQTESTHIHEPEVLPPLHNDSITPKDIADKYTFTRLIGEGSQGQVYEAIRNADHKQVAIKVLNINSIQNWKAYDLFWREVDVLKSLNIKGVAEFYDAIEELNPSEPHAYLIQQYIHGKTLSDMIHSGYRFSVQDIFRFAIQLIDILDQLHHHDPPIIHRDLKPSNIILEPCGSSYQVYLTDFGAVSNPVLQKGGSTVAGTYGYMPPEQLMGNPSPGSDIYALGVTLVELLSGVSPADMETIDYRLGIEKPLEQIPYTVVSCLRGMTTPDLTKRVCDIQVLRKSFQAFSEGNFIITESLPTSSSLSPKEFNIALKQVSILGQKGNFDLWLHLSEQTPRQVPRCYSRFRCLLQHKTQIDFDDESDYNDKLSIPFAIHHPLVPIKIIISRLFKMLLYFISILIFGPFFWLGTLIKLFQKSEKIERGDILLFIYFSILFITACSSALIYSLPFILIIPIGTFIFGLAEDILNQSIFSITETKSNDKYLTLIQHGRKTMASIIQIEYVAATDIDHPTEPAVDLNSTVNYPRLELSDGHYERKDSYKYYLSDALPVFKITYTFNPPDDSQDSDIVHQIYVHFDPCQKLKPGDMLPILYYIHPNDNRIVTSTPFPYPVDKIYDIDDIFCTTKDNLPCSSKS